ncbi:Exosome complex component rrp40 [Sesamum angolense]|uniref:Exosome complex component rrp40 n=1 Tax=Sesamum angolense TaxID=2727404 RepID=A0AAE2BRC0_9LAMI|nr:Exosome complex component rrp40 [Sesamum angolense]
MKSLNRIAEGKSYNRNDWPSRPSRPSNNISFSAFKILNSEHSGLCKIRGQVVANTKLSTCRSAFSRGRLLLLATEHRAIHANCCIYFFSKRNGIETVCFSVKLRRSTSGDVVLDLSKMTNQTIKLGGGLRQDGDVISVMKAGKLRFSKPNKYWVESSHKRYVPSAGDNVLGIVVDAKADNLATVFSGSDNFDELFVPSRSFIVRRNDVLFQITTLYCCMFLCPDCVNFLVDIKGPMLAFLPVLAFEGGTRRNIPKFEMGTLLYVRVVKANTGMNPELSCMDGCLWKSSRVWPLKDGFMFESSTGLSRTLLSTPTCPVLETLGKKLAFEIAVGLNGRVWVNATSPSIIVLVANTIMQMESLSPAQQKIKTVKKSVFDLLGQTLNSVDRD